MMKKILFVGWVNQGRKPVDGETTKNQHIIAILEKYCWVYVLDFYQKKKHPWIFLQAVWAFVKYPKATIVLSTSAQNVYSMLKFFKTIGIKREIIHWVIGGAFGEYVKNGRFKVDVFNNVKYNLVQCYGMIDELQSAGITNAKFVPNFRQINYLPDLNIAISQRRDSPKIRFVFLSRIMTDKGCDYLLNAIKKLNEKGLQDKYIVDFYGKIDSSYRNVFIDGIDLLSNACYRGLLDLRCKEGYDILCTYHALLFPTFHPTEGFSGIFIDSFIAGLPVLASDWSYNKEIIEDGKLGTIYPVHNVGALMIVMEKCINEEIDLYTMAVNARKMALKYKSEIVLSVDCLKSLGLIE